MSLSKSPSIENGGLFTRTATSTEIKYSIGYRRAFLRAPVGQGDSNINTIAMAHLPTGTFVFDVAFGPKTPRKIVIVADELIFYSGMKYNFPAQDLELRCRTLSFINKNTGAYEPTTIDLSGVDGDPATNVGSDHGSASDASVAGLSIETFYESDWFSIQSYAQRQLVYDDDYKKQPTPAGWGGSGGIGGPGGRGGDAGSFTLHVDDLHIVSPLDTPYLTIIAMGGKGGTGGRGGSGGRGGDGFTVHQWSDKFHLRPNTSGFRAWGRQLLEAFEGGRGGDAGPGGPGGRGGHGGSVNIFYRNGPANATISRLFNFICSKGADGPNGSPGDPGKGGRHCDLTSGFWSPIVSAQNNGRLEPDREVTVRNRAIHLINQWAQSGWKSDFDLSALDGYPGDTPSPIATEKLWGYMSSTQVPGADGTQKINKLDWQAFSLPFAEDIFFLSSLTNRLYFEANNYFTCQPYLPGPGSLNSAQLDLEKLTEQQKEFRSLYVWVSQIVRTNKDVTQGTSPVGKVLQLNLDTFSHSFEAGVDIYGNAIAYVPNPRIGTPNIDGILEDYGFIETTFAAALDALEGAERDRQILHDKVSDLDGKIKLAYSAREDEQKTRDQLHTDIKNVEVTIQDTKNRLLDETRKLELDIKAEMHCDMSWTRVLEALAVALMFCQPTSASMAGAALSIGTSAVVAGRESVDTICSDSGTKVEKEYLLTRLKLMREDGLALKAEIGEFLKQSAEEREQHKVISRLVADKTKFDSMCEQYLMKIPRASEVKEIFSSFIDAIQQRSELLAGYNSCAIRLAKLGIQIKNYEANKAAFTASSGSTKSGHASDGEVQLAADFLKSTFAQISQQTFQSIYEFWRAFNCATLGRTTFYESFGTLQTFGNVSQALLRANFSKCYASDVDGWHKRVVKSSRQETVKQIILDNTNNKYMLQRLRDKRTLCLDLDWKLAQQHNWDDKYFDLRLNHLEVYLVGAKVNVDKLGAGERDDPNALSTINIDITSGGTFRYIGVDNESHQYSFPKDTFSFTYKINKNVSEGENERYEPISKMVKWDEVVLGLRNLGEIEQIPLQSPLGTWIIEPEKTVDLSGVTKVKFLFFITGRKHGH